MDAKPSDLFLNVIEFFGVLIPGGLIVFMHSDFIFEEITPPGIIKGSTVHWILVFSLSYIIGCILFTSSERLAMLVKFQSSRKSKTLIEKILKWCLNHFKFSRETREYYDAVKDSVIVPKSIRNEMNEKNKSEAYHAENVYYSAFNYVCLNNSNAITELERQAAKSKLFRSLALFFSIESILQLMVRFSFIKFVAFIVAALISFWLFVKLLDWTYQLSFIYFYQLKNNMTSEDGLESKKSPEKEAD